MPKKISKKPNSKLPAPKKSGDIPATTRHLELVRNELKSDIATLRIDTKSEFVTVRAEMQSEFAAVRSEMQSQFAAVRSEFADVRAEMRSGFAKFTQFESDLSQIKSIVFQTHALLEEQNSRNRVALDGYTAVYDRQTVNEKRLDKLEMKVFGANQK